MIISRTAWRISFVGGGSDLPAFYTNETGAVLSTAINKYIYITVNKKFDNKIRAILHYIQFNPFRLGPQDSKTIYVGET